MRHQRVSTNGPTRCRLDDVSQDPKNASSTGRWARIKECWETSGLGDEPPEWLTEFPTEAEMTLAELQEGVRSDARAWRVLCDAFHAAGAGEPPAALRAHAKELVAAIRDPAPPPPSSRRG
jgi:hypothetical protein